MESLNDFQTAFQARTAARLDRSHSDATKYRAFRFVQRGVVTVGIARSITIDAAGHVIVRGEPGTVMYGRTTSGNEYSHVLLPFGVSPP